MRRAPVQRPRAGLTLVELVLALGLFALLAVALVELLDTTLSIWEEAEVERERLGREAALVQWFERDLEFLAGGERGDLLFDWELVDVDGDGIATRPTARLRLVRRAVAEDFDRLGARRVLAGGEVAPTPGTSRPLIEVLWALELDGGAAGQPVRGDGRLLRAECVLDGPPTYFDRDAFGAGGRVLAEGAQAIAAGVLHWELQFASQTTSLLGGWRVGEDLAAASSAWDARDGSRLAAAREHPLNAMAPGTPPFDGRPLLPRRVRLVIELERPDRTARRPRLRAPVGAEDLELLLGGARDLPRAGDLVLIGEEWVRVTSIVGERMNVVRGERGTRPIAHPEGSPVQFGDRIEREFTVPQHEEDWNL